MSVSPVSIVSMVLLKQRKKGRRKKRGDSHIRLSAWPIRSPFLCCPHQPPCLAPLKLQWVCISVCTHRQKSNLHSNSCFTYALVWLIGNSDVILVPSPVGGPPRMIRSNSIPTHDTSMELYGASPLGSTLSLAERPRSIGMVRSGSFRDREPNDEGERHISFVLMCSIYKDHLPFLTTTACLLILFLWMFTLQFMGLSSPWHQMPHQATLRWVWAAHRNR